ncbi:thioredoxin family protein [Paenibacillus sp. MER 180]|uniref:Thioredoxin family protein n=1 Tax=Paenibacillus suaedae TaxID=3077233 RepID=A0AAJ2K3S1_9BACL|nr:MULTISPECIES: thioredoxin family protein [unclassified Paenibacillus]MCM3291928.1 thioredoxin family protein [Paenibacillus sp. MER 180]MDT8979552.1 thioredoxin family protein [Paenibacillus sp. chi10]OBY80824.1 thiol reductase thioredoxin [Paenibacillus sp. KS1]GAV14499.1 thioredoxin domain-containing protein [Paenibacillus sp. NAIST15-1]
MERIETVERFNEIIAQEEPVVAVFKTSWCPDCHFIDPFMPELETNYAGKVTFVEIDSEKLLDVAQQYHILGIPSFVAFKGGKETIRFVNKLRKTRPEIEQFVDRAIAVSAAV